MLFRSYLFAQLSSFTILLFLVILGFLMQVLTILTEYRVYIVAIVCYRHYTSLDNIPALFIYIVLPCRHIHIVPHTSTSNTKGMSIRQHPTLELLPTDVMYSLLRLAITHYALDYHFHRISPHSFNPSTDKSD